MTSSTSPAEAIRRQAVRPLLLPLLLLVASAYYPVSLGAIVKPVIKVAPNAIPVDVVVSDLDPADAPPSCSSDIYCQGQILHVVQTKGIYADSKTFVDMKVRESPEVAVERFQKLMNDTQNNPTFAQVEAYVNATFEEGDELQDWDPSDWTDSPKALASVRRADYREWAHSLNGLWRKLGRKVREDVQDHPELYSLLYVPNGFIIPGGRFKELYYWDTYWIVQGLLVCDMTSTVKGVIENLLHLVKKIGFIPNGTRVYYLERSQPPLLSAMMRSYFTKTQDLEFIENNIDTLEKEFEFWMNNSLVEVEVNGKIHKLARYYAPSNGPRPESYKEDYETAEHLTDEKERSKLYWELKSGAASGWDFTSRWFIDDSGSNTGGLKNIHTSKIVPVDLNAFLYGAARNLEFFFTQLKGSRSHQAALHYGQVADQLREAVQAVLWNEEDGIWYDYDLLNKKQRPFFYGSNMAPLWADCYDTSKRDAVGAKVVQYVNNVGIREYFGGTPSSLNQTGEQWDFPNCWAPVQAFLIQGLDKTNQPDAVIMAADFANRWLNANFIGFNKTGMMFEKYDALNIGQFGGGGEYTVQAGFGWTNGLALELLMKYGTNANSTVHNPLVSNSLYNVLDRVHKGIKGTIKG